MSVFNTRWQQRPHPEGFCLISCFEVLDHTAAVTHMRSDQVAVRSGSIVLFWDALVAIVMM